MQPDKICTVTLVLSALMFGMYASFKPRYAPSTVFSLSHAPPTSHQPIITNPPILALRQAVSHAKALERHFVFHHSPVVQDGPAITKVEPTWLVVNATGVIISVLSLSMALFTRLKMTGRISQGEVPRLACTHPSNTHFVIAAFSGKKEMEAALAEKEATIQQQKLLLASAQRIITDLEERLAAKEALLQQTELLNAEQLQKSQQVITDLEERLAAKEALLQQKELLYAEQLQKSQQDLEGVCEVFKKEEVKMVEREVGSPLAYFQGHTYCVSGVAISPNKKVLASVSEDCTLLVWDIATREELFVHEHEGSLSAVAISLDNKWVSCGRDGGLIHLWDLETGSAGLTLDAHDWVVSGLAFSPDHLASCSWDKTIRFWDIMTGEQKRTLSVEGEVWSIAYSPDFQLLASGDGCDVVIWDVATGARKHTFKGHTDTICGVAISPDGKLVVSSSRDDTIRLWTLDGQFLRFMKLPPSRYWIYTPSAFQFSYDSQWLAGAFDKGKNGEWDEGGDCCLWNVATGALAKRFSRQGCCGGKMAATDDLSLWAVPTYMQDKWKTQDFWEIELYGMNFEEGQPRLPRRW